MKKLSIAFSAVVLFSPPVLFAYTEPSGTAQKATDAATTGITSIDTIITTFTTTVVKSLGALLLAAALVAFFWGVVQYIWGNRSANAQKINDGNKFMGWGLLALFVMFSVYGIIQFGQRIFFNGIDVTKITIPEINFGRSSSNGNSTTNPGGTNTAGNAGNPLGGGGASSGGTGNTGAGSAGAGSSSSDNCPSLSVGAACTTSSGTQGTCAQGSAARDYQLYCSADSGGSGSGSGSNTGGCGGDSQCSSGMVCETDATGAGSCVWGVRCADNSVASDYFMCPDAGNGPGTVLQGSGLPAGSQCANDGDCAMGQSCVVIDQEGTTMCQ
jgi:hypothetical protein